MIKNRSSVIITATDRLPCPFADRQLDGLAFLPTIIDIH
jgi:hypothetical protein